MISWPICGVVDICKMTLKRVCVRLNFPTSRKASSQHGYIASGLCRTRTNRRHIFCSTNHRFQRLDYQGFGIPKLGGTVTGPQKSGPTEVGVLWQKLEVLWPKNWKYCGKFKSHQALNLMTSGQVYSWWQFRSPHCGYRKASKNEFISQNVTFN